MEKPKAALQRAVTAPLVISMGRTRDEHIQKFRRGAGPIVDEVREVMRLVRDKVDLNGGKRVLLPIVVIYTDKP